jgi:hypothetical protein
VRHPSASAKVYFDKGMVVHAKFGDIVGADAVYALFLNEQGSFEFTLGLPAPETTISTSTENLILEAIRRLDESRREEAEEEPKVARDAVVTLGDSEAVELTLQPDEWKVLGIVNGSRNVTQIAIEAGLEPERVIDIIGRLLAVGALKLSGKRARTARLVTRLAEARFPSGAAGLDPGILMTWERTIGYPPIQVLCRLPNGKVTLFRAEPVEGAGPYVHFSRDTLMHGDMAVDVTLLVRPAPPPG